MEHNNMKRWVAILCVFSILPLSCASSKVLRQEKARTYRQLGEGYLAEGNTSAALRELLRAKELNQKDPGKEVDQKPPEASFSMHCQEDRLSL
jgi:Tfp pilus assembly protein PilF